MSHTTQCPSDAGCLAGEAPAEATKMQGDRLRRATRIVQYFPYTDLTTPSEVQKNRRMVRSRPAPTGARSWCGGSSPVSERAPPCAERDHSDRTPAPCLRLDYWPVGVRSPCQASRT